MFINLNSLLRNLLLFFILVYFSQGPLYPTGNIIGKLSLLGILLICSYYFIKSLTLISPKPLLFYLITLLLTVNFIGYLLSGNYNGIYFSQLRNILTALLPFFAFYYLAKKGFLEEKNLLLFFILMLPIAIASFYQSRSVLLSNFTNETENIVTNTAYFFATLIPFVFFWGKRKTLAIISLLILVFFIIQGAKRGAIITAVIGILIFSYYQFINTSPDKKIRGYLISLIGLFAIIYFSIQFFENNEFLIRRIQAISEGGSGRDIIYTNLLSAWYNSNNIINYLFGFGFVATIDYSGTGHLAHNDWLELLINFGLFGIAVYLFIFISIFRYLINTGIPKTDRLIMLAIVCMWFLQTLFSMYYTSSNTAITMLVLGYLVGIQKNNFENIKLFKN